ncbi:hypothetical protein CFC21_016975, partial [Triticum aestivum]
MAANPDREVCHRAGRGGKMLLPVMAVLAAVVLASLPSAAVATNYTVGDEKGWNPKVDYTSWVKKHRPFYTGDWLLFEYQNGRSDVVQVDEVGLRQLRQGERHQQPQQGDQLRIPAQGGQGLLLHLQLRLLLLRHEARRHRQEGPRLFLPRLRLVLLLLAGRQVILQIRRLPSRRPQRRPPRRRRGRRRHATQDAL